MKSHHLVLFLLLLFLSAGEQLIAQNSYLNRVEEYLNHNIDEGALTGAYVGYIQADGTVSELTLGVLGKAVNRQVSNNTIFEIGSISKTFTATLLANMVQNSEYTLDSPIKEFLPDSISVPTHKKKEITLGHLATHTSGLPRLPSNFSPETMLNPYVDYTVQNMYSFLDDYELSNAPGSKVAYSNFGMGLLGHILELHYRKSYEELVNELIAEPLDMESTGMIIQQSDSSRFAAPYNYGSEADYWDFPTLAGAGGLRSTGSDMIQYIKAQLGMLDTSLDEEIKATHAIQYDSGEGLIDDIGLGWFYATEHDTLIWHNGGTGGFKSFAGINKENGTGRRMVRDHLQRSGVVVLANGTSEIPDGVGLYLLDSDHELPEIKESVEVSQERLDLYTGTYQITPMFGITVTAKDGQLFAQATGQQKFPVFPESQTVFYYKVVEAKLEFVEDKNGEFNELILHQGGREMTGKKSAE